MSIFPINTALQEQLDSISLSNNDTDTISNGKSFVFDFSTGQYLVVDGRLVVATEEGALKIWIQKVLKTEKNKFEIYKDKDYGVNFEGLLFNNSNDNTFIISQLKSEITEALSKNPKIRSIQITSMTRENSGLNIGLIINGVEVNVGV